MNSKRTPSVTKNKVKSSPVNQVKEEPDEPIVAIQDIPFPLRYQDLCFAFSTRVAKAHLDGWFKYEQDRLPPGQKNFHLADLEFALGRLGNAIKHLQALQAVYEYILHEIPLPKDVDLNEDHLGHAGANMNMLAKFEQLQILPSTASITDISISKADSRTYLENYYKENIP